MSSPNSNGKCPNSKGCFLRQDVGIGCVNDLFPSILFLEPSFYNNYIQDIIQRLSITPKQYDDLMHTRHIFKLSCGQVYQLTIPNHK